MVVVGRNDDEVALGVVGQLDVYFGEQTAHLLLLHLLFGFLLGEDVSLHVWLAEQPDEVEERVDLGCLVERGAIGTDCVRAGVLL